MKDLDRPVIVRVAGAIMMALGVIWAVQAFKCCAEVGLNPVDGREVAFVETDRLIGPRRYSFQKCHLSAKWPDAGFPERSLGTFS